MFKRISSKDYTVTPYQANKRFVFDKDNENLTNFLGINYPESNYFKEEEEIQKDGDGEYLRNVYDLIRHFYYRSDESFQTFGVERQDKINLDEFPTDLYSSISAIKISSNVYGEKVKPGTVEISFEFAFDSQANPNFLSFQVSDLTFTVEDDGFGNLYVDDRFVGNVFYANGVIVLFWKNIANAIGVPTGELLNPSTGEPIQSGPVYAIGGVFQPVSSIEYMFTFLDYEIEFRSTVTRYEHEVSCTINPGEFNGVTNPSVKKENGEFIDYFEGELTDEEGNPITFLPYITTVGLYDEFLNLVAVGKLARPIQKPDDIPLTLIVEFDT